MFVAYPKVGRLAMTRKQCAVNEERRTQRPMQCRPNFDYDLSVASGSTR